jgi:hypothetical protein
MSSRLGRTLSDPPLLKVRGKIGMRKMGRIGMRPVILLLTSSHLISGIALMILCIRSNNVLLDSCLICLPFLLRSIIKDDASELNPR